MEVILAIAPKVSLEPNAMLTLMNVMKVKKKSTLFESNFFFNIVFNYFFQL